MVGGWGVWFGTWGTGGAVGVALGGGRGQDWIEEDCDCGVEVWGGGGVMDLDRLGKWNCADLGVGMGAFRVDSG